MPTEDIVIYQLCPRCQGTRNPGIILNGNNLPVPAPICPTCNNEKYVPVGKMASGNQIDKVLRRLKKIMQALNTWEEGD